MAQVEGEVFGSRWNCVLDYSTSTSAYSVSVSGSCIFRSRGYGMSLNGFYAHVDINGNTNSTESTSFYSPTGGWVDKTIISHSRSFTRTQSDYTIYINACIDRTGSSYAPGKSIPTAYITIPALEHHTVSYNANGGSGAPGSQTKWYGSVLTLSSTKPTRTGYTFQGWATSASGSVAYSPGGSYGADSDVTLYAVWKANTWTVTFNANGGSGAPSAQTKTYGVDLTLSSTKPTRSLYNFLGWGTSENSTTAAYQPGGKYTANTDITLYAVWELAWVSPTLTNSKCYRCNSSGAADDLGTYAKLSGDWTTDRAVKSIVVTVNGTNTTLSGTGKTGTISVTLGAGKLSAENSYEIKLVITDEVGSGTWTWTISATHYILDFAPNGSVGVNTVADSSNQCMSVDMPINGGIFYSAKSIETGDNPLYVLLGTWDLSSNVPKGYMKSCLSVDINAYGASIQSFVTRSYEATASATTSAFNIVTYRNAVIPTRVDYTYWLELFGIVTGTKTIQLWVKVSYTYRAFDYCIHGSQGKWTNSNTGTTTEPSGTKVTAASRYGNFNVGSGLTMSNSGTLSVNAGKYITSSNSQLTLDSDTLMTSLFHCRASGSNMNDYQPGFQSYTTATSNRPNSWGVCLTLWDKTEAWKFQLALPTEGDPKWRRNINNQGWSSWWTWSTA